MANALWFAALVLIVGGLMAAVAGQLPVGLAMVVLGLVIGWSGDHVAHGHDL